MLHWEDDFLKDTAKLEKLYRSCLQDAAAGYQLSRTKPRCCCSCATMRRSRIPQPTSRSPAAFPRRWSRAAWMGCTGAASLPASGMKATAASCISACAGKAPQRRRSCRKAVGRLHAAAAGYLGRGIADRASDYEENAAQSGRAAGTTGKKGEMIWLDLQMVPKRRKNRLFFITRSHWSCSCCSIGCCSQCWRSGR